MSASVSVRRPFGITLLMVIGVIQGVLNILAGLFVILDRDDAELQRVARMSEDQLLWFGIGAVAFGALIVLLAQGLGAGSEGVRILFAVIATFNLAVGVWALFALHGEQQASGAGSAIFGGLALYLLFNHRAEEFFESRRA